MRKRAMKYLPIIEYPDMRGFTLIEVTVVLFLMVLIIGISAVFIAGRLPATTIAAAGR
jgi:prepilin-type N-terminal cleavage/methylation domain-containing protein